MYTYVYMYINIYTSAPQTFSLYAQIDKDGSIGDVNVDQQPVQIFTCT